MKTVTARLRKVATGEERDYSYEIEDQYLENQAFSWEENNYSCDCNRFAIFDDDNDGEVGFCAGEGRYELLSLTCDGESLLSKDDPDVQFLDRMRAAGLLTP